MPYTHCAACGAKALIGATRCPRCQTPFVSYDPKGERVPTVNCPNCGVQRPVAIGVCPNCLMSTAPSGWRLTRGLILVGLAIGVIVAVGYAISRRTGHTKAATTTIAAESTVVADSAGSAHDTMPSASDTTVKAPPAVAVNTPATTPAPAVKLPAATAPVAKATAPTQPVERSSATGNVATTAAPRPAPPPSVAVPDTGVWEYAVAKTWVRVRSAPSIGSEMLRMVDSAQRVRLGPPTNGWRPVRVGVDRGWVDPRLFTVVPAPKP
jgi:hypothetical protein